jgi:hypothetical protein
LHGIFPLIGPIAACNSEGNGHPPGNSYHGPGHWMALIAASPVWPSWLPEIDCRSDVWRHSDLRTPEERGWLGKQPIFVPVFCYARFSGCWQQPPGPIGACRSRGILLMSEMKHRTRPEYPNVEAPPNATICKRFAWGAHLDLESPSLDLIDLASGCRRNLSTLCCAFTPAEPYDSLLDASSKTIRKTPNTLVYLVLPTGCVRRHSYFC